MDNASIWTVITSARVRLDLTAKTAGYVSHFLTERESNKGLKFKRCLPFFKYVENII